MFVLIMFYCMAWVCCRATLKTNSPAMVSVLCFMISACSVGAVVIHQHNLGNGNGIVNYFFLATALVLAFVDMIDKDQEKIFLSAIINLTLAAFVLVNIIF